MKYANQINDLVVKFIRVDIEGENQILIMERLTILEPRSLEKEVRETLFSVFVDELKHLNKEGFCHREIKRPSGYGGHPYDNIILTPTGIRLIDVGISAIKETAGETLFARYTESEMKEVDEFYEYFLEQ